MDYRKSFEELLQSMETNKISQQPMIYPVTKPIYEAAKDCHIIEERDGDWWYGPFKVVIIPSTIEYKK